MNLMTSQSRRISIKNNNFSYLKGVLIISIFVVFI